MNVCHFWIEIWILRKIEETTRTQKYEKTHRRKNKMEETMENQTSYAKENQMGGINAEKRQTSIP